MKDNICYGCMEVNTIKNGRCVSCGYVNGSEERDFLLKPGMLIEDRYIIGKCLGIGGFGITYIAMDIRINVRVAIKEFYIKKICTRGSDSEVQLLEGQKHKRLFKTYREKFLDEARLLANYNNNDGIVTVSDYFQGFNTAYLVMEYLEGKTLDEYFQGHDLFDGFHEVKEMLLPIMEALQDVHQKGFIHRDISPDNIFMTDEGQMKLLDFGAARENNIESDKKLSVILKNGYAPVEQYDSNGKQGPYTDIYALGATIYRMLEGKKPIEALERSKDSDEDIMGDMSTHLSSHDKKVLSKMLALEHKKRYQNISELMQELGFSTNISKKSSWAIFNRKVPKVVKKVFKILYLLICIAGIGYMGYIYSISEVADYIGRSEEEVNKIAEYSKLKIKFDWAYDDTVENGYVISQSITEETAYRWDEMQITVSKGSGEVIEFVDQQLERVIRKNANVKDGDIHLGDVEAFEILDLSNQGIVELAGISKLKNLKVLNLSGNQIIDIEPIKGLESLRILNLHDNNIESLDAVSDMISLEKLIVSQNSIREVNSIKGLVNLAELSIYGNHVTEISSIDGMVSMEVLSLGDNSIEDITPLLGLTSLRVLLLNGNEVADISGLGHIESLEFVSLKNNNIDYEVSGQHVKTLENNNIYVEK